MIENFEIHTAYSLTTVNPVLLFDGIIILWNIVFYCTLKSKNCQLYFNLIFTPTPENGLDDFWSIEQLGLNGSFEL